MAKSSRRQRKQLREKRDRAESHGLPVGALAEIETGALSRFAAKSRLARQSGIEASPARESDGGTEVEPEVSGSTGGFGWVSWPLSVKLAIAGILILVALGLFLRLTEDQQEGAGSAARNAIEPVTKPVVRDAPSLQPGRGNLSPSAPAASPE